jgi:hypothetical protein
MSSVNTALAERIRRLTIPEPNSGCWLWSGSLGTAGYGVLRVNHKTRSAHRVSYEAHKEPIPNGMHIDHKCRVRTCVNPDHLEPVTVAENNRRAPRTIIFKTHCKHGHPFSGDNLQIGKQRNCRECRRRIGLASYYRTKGRKNVL